MASYTSTTQRNNLATAYGTNATHGALTTTAPSASASGTEVSGGSYARIPTSWGAASNGAITSGALNFSVPAGTTVVGFALFNALTAGTYLGGADIPSQNFASAGTYAITPTYTQN